MCAVVVETGASCYNFQLKSLLVKSMLDALFLSTYALYTFIIPVNKMYHAVDITYYNLVDK